MSRRFPPIRPSSFQVEGAFHDRGGAGFSVDGRLTVTVDNDAVIEGGVTVATGEDFTAPTVGSFHGRLDDGIHVEFASAHVDQLSIRWGSIGSGWSICLSAIGHVDWVACRPEDEDVLDVDVTVWWTLTHSALLWHAAKPFFKFESDRMAAAGVTAEVRQRAIESPRPNPCAWDIEGVRFEIGWFEEHYAVEDRVTRYPVRATRFVPRAKASTRFCGTGAGLRDELNRIDTVLERLLACIGFLQEGRVRWYERTEDAEASHSSLSPAHVPKYRCARLLVGRFPEAALDSRRALLCAQALVAHAPTLVQRFSAGEPFTSAALDAYLLAREAQRWPSRLLLLSTALESLKELFLRTQGQRGILADDHWSGLQAALESQLKQGWKDAYGPKELRGLIKSKMRELNRPSYRQTLEAMVAAWGVALDGLTDPFGFIKLRDALVHTGQVAEADHDALGKATGTAGALFERLMAAWLQLPVTGSDGLGTP